MKLKLNARTVGLGLKEHFRIIHNYYEWKHGLDMHKNKLNPFLIFHCGKIVMHESQFSNRKFLCA